MKEASDEISNERNEEDGELAHKMCKSKKIVRPGVYIIALQKMFCSSRSAGPRNSTSYSFLGVWSRKMFST